ERNHAAATLVSSNGAEPRRSQERTHRSQLPTIGLTLAPMTRAPIPQVALVTGASSGFGLLAAVSLAKSGLRVFASMRELSRRGALDQAVAAAGVSLNVVALDVTKPDTFIQALAQVGPVDVMVNNAGVGM